MKIKKSELNRLIDYLINEEKARSPRKQKRDKIKALNRQKRDIRKMYRQKSDPFDDESYDIPAKQSSDKKTSSVGATKTQERQSVHPAHGKFLTIISASDIGIHFTREGQAGKNAYSMLRGAAELTRAGEIEEAKKLLLKLKKQITTMGGFENEKEDLETIDELVQMLTLVDDDKKSDVEEEEDDIGSAASNALTDDTNTEQPKPSPERTKLLIKQIQNNIGAPSTGNWDDNTQEEWESWITGDETIAKIIKLADAGVLSENKIIKENFIFESLKSRKLDLILETTAQEVYDAIFVSKNDATKLAKILGYSGNIEGVASMVDDIDMEDIGDVSKGFDLEDYLEDFDINMSSNKQDSAAASRSSNNLKKQGEDNTGEKTKKQKQKTSTDQTKTKKQSDKSPKKQGEITYNDKTIGWRLDSNKADGVSLEIPSSLQRVITDNIKKRLKKQSLFNEMERVVNQYSEDGDVERAKVLNVVRNKYNWNKTLRNRGMSQDDLDSLLAILKTYEKIRL